MTIHVAIVGAGSAVADDHRTAFAAVPGATVVAGVDPDPAARERVAGRWGVPVFADLGDLATSGLPVDLAVICAPDRMHVALGRASSAFGWHTLVEKPLAASVREARALFSHAERHGRYLAVAHQRALMAPQLDELVAARTYGTVQSMVAWWRRADHGPAWRLGLPASSRAGVLADLGTHLVSLTDRLMQHTTPRSVTAVRFARDAAGVETLASALITYQDGATVHLTTAWSCTHTRGEDTALLVEWERATATTPLLTYDTPAEASQRPPTLHVGDDLVLPLRPLLTVPECHAALARQVVEAVRRGVPAPATEVAATLRVVAILEAAYRSAEAAGRRAFITI